MDRLLLLLVVCRVLRSVLPIIACPVIAGALYLSFESSGPPKWQVALATLALTVGFFSGLFPKSSVRPHNPQPRTRSHRYRPHEPRR